MAEEYTIKEFAKLWGEIADHKIDDLCTNAVKAVGDVFIDKAVKSTPNHRGGYNFPSKWQGKGYSKSSTGLRKGWEENKGFKVSKGSGVYTAVITNKAKSSYKSGYTGKSRTDYYAHYVDEGHMHWSLFKPMEGDYIPYLDRRVPSQFIEGRKFTNRAIHLTNRKVNSVVGKEVEKWVNEVF